MLAVVTVVSKLKVVETGGGSERGCGVHRSLFDDDGRRSRGLTEVDGSFGITEPELGNPTRGEICKAKRQTQLSHARKRRPFVRGRYIAEHTSHPSHMNPLFPHGQAELFGTSAFREP